MTFEEVEAYYINGYQFHKKTKMSHVTFLNWKRWGYVPYTSQLKLEKITKGKLKATES